MIAPKLRFSYGLKAKAPDAVTARVPASTPLVEIFTGRVPIDWTQEATMVKVRIFFYLRGSFECMIVILPTFWRSAPALKFSGQLPRYVSLVTMLIQSYRQSLDKDGRSLWVGTSRSSFTAILRAVWFFFSPSAPVTSFLPLSQFPPSYPSHSLSTRRNKLSPRSSSSWKPSSVQIVPACVASGNIHNAVSRHFDKNRAKHRRTVSQWTRPKRASSDQRTDEEDTSETCNNNHVGGRALTNASKRNWGGTYIYVLGHRMVVSATYSKTCLKRPPRGARKNGRYTQVVS